MFPLDDTTVAFEGTDFVYEHGNLEAWLVGLTQGLLADEDGLTGNAGSPNDPDFVIAGGDMDGFHDLMHSKPPPPDEDE